MRNPWRNLSASTGVELIIGMPFHKLLVLSIYILPLLAIVRAHFTDPRPVTPDEEVAREAVMRLFGAARKVPRDQRRPLVRQLLRDAGLIE